MLRFFRSSRRRLYDHAKKVANKLEAARAAQAHPKDDATGAPFFAPVVRRIFPNINYILHRQFQTTVYLVIRIASMDVCLHSGASAPSKLLRLPECRPGKATLVHAPGRHSAPS